LEIVRRVFSLEARKEGRERAHHKNAHGWIEKKTTTCRETNKLRVMAMRTQTNLQVVEQISFT